jgi:ATP-dependent helicase HrpA
LCNFTNVTNQLKSIETQLQHCMLADRFGFRKQFKKLKSAAAKDRIDSRAVGRLQRELSKSVKLARHRFDSLPKIDYPAELPISERVDEIREVIKSNQVVILAGETGSGKTTQLPKICLSMGRGVKGLIGHTQPRRVAARTVANRIAEELQVPFGDQVGYQVRFTDHSTDKTLLKVMTDGVLLAETQNDRFLEKYDTLIIDEAHERSLNIDFLLGYIKRLMPRRKDLKVIITSATIDVDRFSRHFNDAPVIEVSGRTYPVKVLYRPLELVKDHSSRDADELMYQGIIDAVHEIQTLDGAGKAKARDVLVFLSGEREIREVSHLLRKARMPNTEVLPLYSRLSVAEQNRIFKSHKGRRIVLATNVAETSLTVPGIRYVIDPGLARISRYSYRSKVQRLPVEAVSRASADQRKGRCGRISDGVCIRLYSEEDFESRSEFTDPEILRTNLGSVILQMLTLRLGRIEEFPFLEKPEGRQINDGFHLLQELEAVDDGRQITGIGRTLSRIPIDLRLGRMLIEAQKLGSLKEVLVIASALAIQDPRDRPHDHQQAADESHKLNWDKDSDFLTLLALWTEYEEKRQALTQSKLRKYCLQKYLSFIRMREWRDVHRQLHLLCAELGYRENNTTADYASVHKALLSGLLGNIGNKGQDSEYQGARNRKFYIFPGSSQFRKQPKWLVCSELVETSRLYARTVARIDSAWIESLSAHLVNRSWSEPHWEKKRGQVVAYEQVTLYGLIIVSGRKVDFGAIDPVVSREIFIQAGLVEMQLNTSAGFYSHNAGLIDEIERMEAKTRRRDILVDLQALYRFYDELLPIDIYDQVSFDQWRKKVEKLDSRHLYLSRDFLLKSAAKISDTAYPDKLQLPNVSLGLDYHFDPEHRDDGVSVNVPVSLLQQLPENQLEWLVPGFLREKCMALLKSLPKSLRKNFVPAPDYVDRAIENMVFDGRSLANVFAERLKRMTGIIIPGDAWNTAALDDHLIMNIRVLDDQGRELGTGRNLNELKQEFGSQSAASLKSDKFRAIEVRDLTAWSFGELPEFIEVEQAGVNVRAYPALVDYEDSVAIELFDNPHKARIMSEQGLLRLVLFELPKQVKYVRKNLSGFDQYSLYYASIGSRDDLQSEVTAAIFRYVFVEGLPIPNDRESFDQRVMRKKDLMVVAEEVSRLMGQVLSGYHEVLLELERYRENHAYAAAVSDINDQLANLVSAGFMNSIPRLWLRQCPRYLNAIRQRLEKLRGDQKRDRESMDSVAHFWKLYRSEVGAADAGTLTDELRAFRWMLEEYRVSLFAQSLGTQMPVSSKRLDKQWAKITGAGR